jgi:hypothetical protein
MNEGDRIANELRERGFAVVPEAFSRDEVDLIRARLAARYDELGRPPTHARPPLAPAKDVEVSPVGLVYHQLGRHFPELVTKILKTPIVDAIRSTLGDDMHLEYTSGILCHDERPFFPWHAHVGGVDNITYRKQGIFPTFEAPERVTALLYLDDLTEEQGTLLVHPRRITDPTEPPFDPNLEEWDGLVELHAKRGTVVILEQCTWHAARPKRSIGIRAFVACYFASRRAPKTSWIDDSFHAAAASDPLLASVLPRT